MAGDQSKTRSTVIDIVDDSEETTSEKPLLQKSIDLTIGDESPQSRRAEAARAVCPEKLLGVSDASQAGFRTEAEELGREDTGAFKQGFVRFEGQQRLVQERDVCLPAVGGDTPPLLSEVCPICDWNQGRSQAEVDAHIDQCIRKEVIYM